MTTATQKAVGVLLKSDGVCIFHKKYVFFFHDKKNKAEIKCFDQVNVCCNTSSGHWMQVVCFSSDVMSIHYEQTHKLADIREIKKEK